MALEVVNKMGTVTEGDTPQVEFQILEAGTGLVPDSLFLSIYNEETGAVINSRNESALTPVSSFIDPQGVLKYNLAMAETVILNTKTVRDAEPRRVRLRWTWLTNSRQGTWLGRMLVVPKDKQLDD